MEPNSFDIFSGASPQHDPLWLDCVEGLEDAKKRVMQFAADKPGKYFITSGGSKNVVAEVDTSAQQTQA